MSLSQSLHLILNGWMKHKYADTYNLYPLLHEMIY